MPGLAIARPAYRGAAAVSLTISGVLALVEVVDDYRPRGEGND
jgi:hypothetical protein